MPNGNTFFLTKSGFIVSTIETATVEIDLIMVDNLL